MEGIQFVRKELDVFVNEPAQAAYDTIVFYNFHRPYPTAAQAKAILGLTERGQGLVILHHAILAFPDWNAYSEICGIVDRSFGYHPRQTLQVQLSDATHPITAGMTAWEMGTDYTDFLPLPTTGKSVGADFGMKDTYLTLSTGEKIQHPHPLKANLNKLRTLNKAFSRKVKGSSLWWRCVRQLARLYRKISNHRETAVSPYAKDFHWQLASELCKKFSCLCP